MKFKKFLSLFIVCAIIISTYFNIESNAYIQSHSGKQLTSYFKYAQYDHAEYNGTTQKFFLSGWSAINLPSGVTFSNWIWSIDNGNTYYYCDSTANTDRPDATSTANGLGGNMNPAKGFSFYADLTQIENLSSGTYSLKFGAKFSNDKISWAASSSKVIPTATFVKAHTPENTITLEHSNISCGDILKVKTGGDGYVKILRNCKIPTENTKVYGEFSTVGGQWAEFDTADMAAANYLAAVYMNKNSTEPEQMVKFTLNSHQGFKACIDIVNDAHDGNVFTTMYTDSKTALMSDGRLKLKGWFTARLPVAKFVYSVDSMATWHDMDSQQIYARSLTSADTTYYANADTAGFTIYTPDLRNEMHGNFRLYIAAVSTLGEKIVFYKRSVSNNGTDTINVVSPSSGSTIQIANDVVQGYSSEFVSVTTTDKYIGVTDQYYPKTATLTWDYSGNPLYYIVTIADNPKFENAAYIKTTGKSVELEDLYTGATYSWKVTAVYSDHTVVSDRFGFMTKWAVRGVKLEGVSNSRDVGGYNTEYGVKTREGLTYRMSCLESNLWGSSNGIKQVSQDKLFNNFGIQFEIDLRGNSSSYLSQMPRYLGVSAPYYYSLIIDPAYKTALTKEVKAFANPENYPMLYHCQIGRDRTGTIAFIINCICGVSEKNLRLDYECSALSTSGNEAKVESYAAQAAGINKMITFFKDYSDGTMGENCAQWCVDYLGVTYEEINNIREILLSDGTLTPAHPIPANYMTLKTSGASYATTDKFTFDTNTMIIKTVAQKFVIDASSNVSEMISSARAVSGKTGGTLKNASDEAVMSGAICTGFKVVFDNAEYGIVVRGDIQGDGSVDKDDAIYMLKNFFSKNDYPLFAEQDVNGDEAYNAEDAIYLVKHVMNTSLYPLGN